MLNSRGFTLIEAMFVLSIILIISSLLMIKHRFNVDDDVIIEEIKHHIYNAKMNAMIYKEKTIINFDESYLMIQSDHMNKKIDLKYALFESDKFSYNMNGHINEGGHIDFVIDKKQYRIIFHLGSGFFEIK